MCWFGLIPILEIVQYLIGYRSRIASQMPLAPDHDLRSQGLVSHCRMVFFLSLSFQGSPVVYKVSVSDAMVRHLNLNILSWDSGSQLS